MKWRIFNDNVEQGLEKHHFDYDEKNMDLYKKYMRVLNSSNLNKVLDRSFISEMVYGPVIRGKSKLELEQFKRLLLEYKKSRTSIIYLTAPKEILLKRREKDLTDFEMIQKFYDKLNLQYDKVMSYSMDFIDVLKLDTSLNSSEEVQRKVKRRILK